MKLKESEEEEDLEERGRVEESEEAEADDLSPPRKPTTSAIRPSRSTSKN